jgi:hypothetical protein
MILDPFLWPGACSDPHVVSPLFRVDSNPWHFQDLNRSSSGSNSGFVMKMAKNVPLKMLIKFFLGCRPKNKMGACDQDITGKCFHHFFRVQLFFDKP